MRTNVINLLNRVPEHDDFSDFFRATQNEMTKTLITITLYYNPNPNNYNPNPKP